LEEAKKQLRDLQSEWAENVRLKENLRKELASVEKAPGNADHPSMIELKEQVEQLVLDNTQGLEEIEDVSRLNP
jgi:Icc-related predicted phosphoesterase